MAEETATTITTARLARHVAQARLVIRELPAAARKPVRPR